TASPGMSLGGEAGHRRKGSISHKVVSLCAAVCPLGFRATQSGSLTVWSDQATAFGVVHSVRNGTWLRVPYREPSSFHSLERNTPRNEPGTVAPSSAPAGSASKEMPCAIFPRPHLSVAVEGQPSTPSSDAGGAKTGGRYPDLPGGAAASA